MTKRKQGKSARPSRSKGPVRPSRASRSPRATRSDSYALCAECTVAQIAPLKTGLLDLLDLPSPVTLDIAAVQRIDTAGMQLIAAFVRERESLGRKVQWRGSAASFSTAARLLGLEPVLAGFAAS